METILALDLGLNMGWCCWNNMELTYGSINMAQRDKPFKVFWKFLDYKIQETRPSYIVLEARIFKGAKFKPFTANVLRWYGALNTFLEVNDINVIIQEVQVTLLRKVMIGKGRATKEDVCKKASEFIGYRLANTNHNTADAILLCIYARDYIFT